MTGSHQAVTFPRDISITKTFSGVLGDRALGTLKTNLGGWDCEDSKAYTRASDAELGGDRGKGSPEEEEAVGPSKVTARGCIGL